MSGKTIVALLALVLVLASVFTAALPFNYNSPQPQQFQLQKTPQINTNAFTPIGKNIAMPKKTQKANIDKLCKTPGFACGGRPGETNSSFVYGYGDSLYYTPYASIGVRRNARPTWFNWSSPGTFFLTEGGFYTAESEGYPELQFNHGPCLTALIERNSSYADVLVESTQNIMAQCEEYGAQTYRSPCGYGENPSLWTGQRIVNPYLDSEILGYTMAHFGEIAWCSWNLSIENPLEVVELDQLEGTFTATWATNMLANGNLSFNRLNEAVIETTEFESEGEISKDHIINGSLVPGVYFASGVSCTANEPGSSELTLCTPFELLDQNGVQKFIVVIARSATPVIPDVEFIWPTPENESVIDSDSTHIVIASNNEPLFLERIVFRNAGGRWQSEFMTHIDLTTAEDYIRTIAENHIPTPMGETQFYVEAISEDGAYTITPTITVTRT